MLAEALRAVGFQVLEADDESGALARAAEDGQRAIAALVAATSGDIGQGASLHARIESQLGRSLPAVLMAAHGFVPPPLGSDERVRVLHKPFEIAELAEVLEAVLASTARGSSPR
jgi:DNA-binding response OmpR family regulator